jgi:hypothetical protein
MGGQDDGCTCTPGGAYRLQASTKNDTPPDIMTVSIANTPAANIGTS